MSSTVAREQDFYGKDFKIRYSLNVRAKDSDEEEWHYYQGSSNVVETNCAEGHDLCAYFPVGFVPWLKYEMYDVMI